MNGSRLHIYDINGLSDRLWLTVHNQTQVQRWVKRSGSAHFNLGRASTR